MRGIRLLYTHASRLAMRGPTLSRRSASEGQSSGGCGLPQPRTAECRETGELVDLPRAVNAEAEAQAPMFDAPALQNTSQALTSVRTSVQNTTRPDPQKLWDVRPLLKKASVEAPGIENSWDRYYPRRSRTLRPGVRSTNDP
jgi:hypothetical protein